MKIKQILLVACGVFFLFGQAHANVSIINSINNEPMGEKAAALEKSIIKNPQDTDSIEKYIKLLSVRSLYYLKAKKDLENSSDDLRTILYFLSDDKTSQRYKDYQAKLDKNLTDMKYFPTNSDRLELAKNLYLQEKYFASAWEFNQIIALGYEPTVCNEYLGDIYQKLSQNKKAIEYYNKSLEDSPKNAEVLYKLAQVYEKIGDKEFAQEKYYQAVLYANDSTILDNAIDIFTKKIAQNPKDTKNYEILSLAYSKKHDYKTAYELLNKAIILDPDDIFLKYSLGEVLYRMGDYQKALDIYDKILQTNKYDTQIRIAKGKFLAALGKPQDAIKEFQVVLLIYPDSMQAKYGIYKTLKGKASIDEIVQQFYPLDVPNTANSEFYYKFGEFLTDANDNDDAIIFYNKAIETDSKNLNAYLALYKTYEVSANNAKSYEIIKKAYQNLPNAPEIRELYSSINSGTSNKKNELALSYIKNNDYAKAIALYEQIEPKSIEIYFSLSNCYKALKDYKKATQVLQDAAKANPANSDIYYAIAVLYLDQNSPQTAKSYLKKSISLNKENLKAIKLLSFLEKKEINVLLDNAYTSYEKGEYREAEAILTKAIKEFPNAPQIYYYRGLVYEAQKNYVEALKDYTEVTKLAPNYDMVYYAIGSLLEKCGKEREALEAYERFLSGDIEDKALIKEVQDKVIKLGDKYY